MPVSRSPSMPVSGSPAYSPDSLPAYRGGAQGSSTPTPSDLITGWGDWFDFRTADGLFEDVGQTTATTDGAVIGSLAGRLGVITFSQATTANKPLWEESTGFAHSVAANATMQATFAERDFNNGVHLYVCGGVRSGITSSIQRARVSLSGRKDAGASAYPLSQNIIQRGNVLTINSATSANAYALNQVVDAVSPVFANGSIGYSAHYVAATGTASNNLNRQSSVVANTTTTAPLGVSSNRCDTADITIGGNSTNSSNMRGFVITDRLLTEEEIDFLNTYYGVDRV